MSNKLEARLVKLEAAVASPSFQPAHRVIGYSVAGCEAASAEMIASGRAEPTDRFVHRLVVTP